MPIIACDVWTTREGQQIEIKMMSSSHLLSTIHFIERNRLNNASEVYHDQNLGDERLNAVNYYLTWPVQYESLVFEAMRRNLIFRGVVKTAQKKLEK